MAELAGVGHFAVQFAKAKGARVFTAVADRDIGFARELGADTVIDNHRQCFKEIARDIDVVLDSLAGETQERSWSVLKPGGIIVSTMSAPNQDTARERQARGTRFLAEPKGEQLAEIARIIDAREVGPVVAGVFPFSEVQAAQRSLEQGGYEARS
jgi:NADPH:quinone reductase-like Zn-dependent oxidoreductase